MHSWVVFAVLVGCVAAQNRYRPPPPNPGSGQNVAILRQDSVLNPDGSYQWSYEAENGIAAQEQGQLKNVAGSNEPGIDAQGSFQYTAPDGTPISLTYRADENGFQPSGAHLPVPPPIPEAIVRSLAWNAAHPEEENQPAGRRF